MSGANINFDRLRHISERTSFGAKTELLLGVTIPEKPGSFLAFCKTLVGKTLPSSTTAIRVKEMLGSGRYRDWGSRTSVARCSNG